MFPEPQVVEAQVLHSEDVLPHFSHKLVVGCGKARVSEHEDAAEQHLAYLRCLTRLEEVVKGLLGLYEKWQGSWLMPVPRLFLEPLCPTPKPLFCYQSSVQGHSFQC